ncbi:MAG TPA: protein kinase [Dokdonella sp.]|uniref:serine/threonine-protein kinase n=1 Tax=Dokdonella sp. TaxID=2291710 RepID=UPI002BBC8674|nr:protein kinase [Dokdonella sp.]HUD41393.1 protein kinase [Dokdonella sp.]
MSGSTVTFEPGGALRCRLVSTMRGQTLHTLEAGTPVGPFRVLRPIGHGGLGVVYLAERADGAFEQQVALKLIAPEADPGVAEILLERERRLLARLHHPNIARLLDGGRSGAGLLWFAMDHVQGVRIDQWCDQRRLDAHARVALVVEVCAAIAYAHARLVVHRDIKPSNILVDDGGVPRLLDFGIAAALDDASDDPARRAATPGYASPEQRRGAPAGVAQDIYQIGRLLQTLLEGRLARRDRADAEAILRRALAEQPERRYANVDALAADLRALLEHRPVAARDGAAAYRLGRLLRRHRLAAGALMLGTLTLIGVVGYFLWSLDRERDRAEREARTARHVSEFMVGLFRAADPALHGGRIPSIDAVLADAPERIGRELAGEPQVMAELLTTIGRTFIALRDFARAQPPLRKAVELTRGQPQTPPLVRAERLRALAITLHDVDRIGERRALLVEAIAGLDPDSREHARTYNIAQQNLAMADLSGGDRNAAIGRLRLALEHGRRLLAEGEPALIADLLGLGNALAEDDPAAALSFYEEAYGSAREYLGARHPYAILAAGGLAGTLARSGRHAEAAAPMREAVSGALQIYGNPSPNYALALLQSASVTAAAGRQAEAIATLRQALAVCEQLSPGNDTLSVDVLEALGDTLLAGGDANAAETSYRRMLERDASGSHAQTLDRGQRPLKLAGALAAQGRCAEADQWRQTARQRAGGFPPDAALLALLDAPLGACD